MMLQISIYRVDRISITPCSKAASRLGCRAKLGAVVGWCRHGVS